MPKAIAMILAGGFGSRLSILSERRAKPAVPFGSNYRLIDFTLSNVMNSNISHVGILTQYKPYSLNTHIGMGEAWGFTGRNSVAKVLPPYVGGKDSDWYSGTADAIFRNLSFIRRFNADIVVILSGDHIYQMPYNDLIDYHIRSKADLTVATQPIPWDETNRFGILKFNESGRIEAFQEKPASSPVSNQANLGIYVFSRLVLEKWLQADAEQGDSRSDFGKDIIPLMLNRCSCYAYEFSRYWRDVGTLQSYWDANMDCLNVESGLDLHRWRVRTNNSEEPFHYGLPLLVHRTGRIANSIVGKGSCIHGVVINSILFRGVVVEEGAEVRDSILLDGTHVEAGSRVNRTITDKLARIGRNTCIGLTPKGAPANTRFPSYLHTGLTLIGKASVTPPDYEIGSNCLVFPEAREDDFPAGKLAAGDTITVAARSEDS